MAEKRSEASKQQKRERRKARNADPVVREKLRLKQAEWRAKNPRYHRDWWQKNHERKLEYARKHMGVTNPTGEIRSGQCEICGKHVEKLRFDHDHATGLFRGWLCHKCNVGLHYVENPAWVESARQYLGRASGVSA